MNKKLLTVLIAVMTLCFTACVKQETNIPVGNMTATIKGNNWKSNNIAGQLTVTGAEHVILLQASDTVTHDLVSIALHNFSDTNNAYPVTYSAVGMGTKAYALVSVNYNNIGNAGVSGQINITSQSTKNIEGNFHFKLTDSSEVTNGKFFANL